MPQYKYRPVDMKYVRENPEEYIIPECLDACKILWDKGIDTVQCSNYDDLDYRYIDLDQNHLSKENKRLLEELINSGTEGFSIGGLIGTPRLYVYALGDVARAELCGLANVLRLQDTFDFYTVDEYLSMYKSKGGKYTILPTGEALVEENPEHANATIEEALTELDDWDLYVESEQRVYKSKYALEHHMKYLKSLEKGRKM